MKKLTLRLLVGLILSGIFLLVGIVIPVFAPEDPTEWNTYMSNLVPSSKHVFGTTGLGQDTFYLLSWATRNSLMVGFFVAFFSTAIGVLVGLLSGFKGGVLDKILTVLMDSFVAIPSLPILILLAVLLQGRASLLLISGVLVIFNWPWPARQARAVALSMAEREFIRVAWFSGSSTLHIITKEIFPYITRWAFANFINTVLVAISVESGLAVIGLSSVEKATLGTMIYWALQSQALLGERWWWIVPPVAAIMLLFIAIFLVSTGYSDITAEKRGR